MSTKINYGICMGVRGLDGKIIRTQHPYQNGKEHNEGDTGLCPECGSLYRAQFPELRERYKNGK